MKFVTKTVLALTAVSMIATPAMSRGRLRTFKADNAQAEAAKSARPGGTLERGRLRTFKSNTLRAF